MKPTVPWMPKADGIHPEKVVRRLASLAMAQVGRQETDPDGC
jgi:hypothetical protein